MAKKYFCLKVICKGTIPEYTVDEGTLKSFENSFDNEEGILNFINKDTNGEVKLKNRELVGYENFEKEFVPTEILEADKNSK